MDETNIEPEWANEAYADPYAVVIDPDPATIITVITIIDLDDDDTLWGVNAWRSNASDQRRYTNEDRKE